MKSPVYSFLFSFAAKVWIDVVQFVVCDMTSQLTVAWDVI